SASASTQVKCPTVTVNKTADAATVSAGDAIGFTVTVNNASGGGTAKSVMLSDALPGGSGINWSISPAYSGPGTCSITGTAPTQTLNCSFGDLASGASASVHVMSATGTGSAGTYNNTATASASNSADKTGSASVTVNAPTLSVTKTADAATVSAGD